MYVYVPSNQQRGKTCGLVVKFHHPISHQGPFYSQKSAKRRVQRKSMHLRDQKNHIVFTICLQMALRGFTQN